MCTDQCLRELNERMANVLLCLANEQEDYLDRITPCFYHCLKDEYIQRAVILFSHIPAGEMQFLSDSAFTDAAITFRSKAVENKLNDRGASLRTVFHHFFDFALLNQIKKSKKKRINETSLFPDLEHNAGSDPTVSDTGNYDVDLLNKAMASLEEEDRKIILWRHYDRLGIDEIARLLAINKKSASNRVYRCMERLKKECIKLKAKK